MRLRFTTLFLAFFIASTVDAATFTSKTNGNASTGGQVVWNEVGVPGAGDRVVITHQITIDVATTLGESLNAEITGTGTVGNGGISSTTLTGVGTAFTTQLRVGDCITTGSTRQVITAIANDNSLTMSTAVAVADSTALVYSPTAIYLSGTSARLTVSAPLTVKGCVVVNYASTTPVNLVTIDSGQGIEFDASGSPGTTATNYFWLMLPASNQYWTLKANGTAPSHCYLRSKTGGGNAWLSSGGRSVGGWLDLSYVDITRIGDATRDFYLYSVGTAGAAKLILYHCNFDACGMPETSTSPNASATVRITACRFTNSANSTYSIQLPSNANSATAILEKDGASYNYFDKTLKFNGGQANWVIGGSIFATKPSTASGSTSHTSWNDCWVRQNVNSWITAGDVTNCVLHFDSASTNPHWIEGQRTGSGTVNINNNVFYYTGAANNGNQVVFNTSATAVTYNVKNNIFLPNGSGTGGGEPVTSDGNLTGLTINVEHNTAWLASAYFLEISHGQSAVESPNRWNSVKSNLCIGGTVSASGKIADNPDITSLVDVVPPANIDKNARYLIIAVDPTNGATFTNQANGYWSKFSTTPGTTDISLDASGGPLFVGAPNGTPAVSMLASWDASLGGAGTDANAWTQVAAGTSGYTPVAFIAYLKKQLAPRNPLLFKAGHDGATIGAVELNFGFFFDRFIRRRTSNDVDQSTPAWRDILDTSRRTRLRKAV